MRCHKLCALLVCTQLVTHRREFLLVCTSCVHKESVCHESGVVYEGEGNTYLDSAQVVYEGEGNTYLDSAQVVYEGEGNTYLGSRAVYESKGTPI